MLAVLLRPFAEVKPREVLGVLLMGGTGFILMAAYYFLKVTREPLILKSGGAELKSFASAGQAVLLLIMTRAYRALAQRFSRRRLTIVVFCFFAVFVGLFSIAAMLNVPIGVPFYLFVGIFNLTVLAQFWSVANDFYSEEQGRRLFAILGIGTASGAIVGGIAGGALFQAWPTIGPLLAGVTLLLLALLGMLVADRLISARAPEVSAPIEAPAAGSPKGSIDRYLMLLAALVLLINAFNLIGEYILDSVLIQAVELKFGSYHSVEAEAEIASFKSNYFTAYNVVTLLLQTLLVSRILRWIGGRGAIFILPIVSMIGWGSAAFFPVLSVLMVAKVAENSVDYSVQNTAWQSMFLVLTRQEKYVAKNTIDTFFVRFGDMCAAGLVFVGARLLSLPTSAFIVLNLALGAVWLWVAWWLHREYPKKAARTAALEASVPA